MVFFVKRSRWLAELPRRLRFGSVFLDVGVLLGLSWEKRGDNDPEPEAV